MPDWLDVNFVQSVLLLGATVIAGATFLAERDTRKDAALERRLDLISTRVAELAAAATQNAEVTGMGWQVSVARRNLRSALAAAPAELPMTQRLADDSTSADDIRLSRGGVSVDFALGEIAARLERLTS